MYDGLSDFYDIFMQEVDYSAWCDFALQFISDKKTGADFGCGSGKFTIELLRRGFDVVGVDSGEKMIPIACDNARRVGVGANFVFGDAQNVRLPQRVEFITAVCDVVNYVKSPERIFQNVYKNLVDGGVFFFDISSEYKLKNVLSNNTFSDEREGVLYVWNNYKNKNSIDMELSFFRQDEDGRYSRFDESQRQYIHSLSDILEKLEKCGFTDVRVYSDYNFSSVKAKSERLYFVARKRND